MKQSASTSWRRSDGSHADRDDALVARFLRGDGREQRGTRVVAKVRGVRASVARQGCARQGAPWRAALWQEGDEVEFDGTVVGVKRSVWPPG